MNVSGQLRQSQVGAFLFTVEYDKLSIFSASAKSLFVPNCDFQGALVPFGMLLADLPPKISNSAYKMEGISRYAVTPVIFFENIVYDDIIS